MPRRTSLEIQKKAIAMYVDGQSVRRCANELGIHRDTAMRIIRSAANKSIERSQHQCLSDTTFKSEFLSVGGNGGSDLNIDKLALLRALYKARMISISELVDG